MTMLNKWWTGLHEVSVNKCPYCNQSITNQNDSILQEDGFYHFSCYEVLTRREVFLGELKKRLKK